MGCVPVPKNLGADVEDYPKRFPGAGLENRDVEGGVFAIFSGNMDLISWSRSDFRSEIWPSIFSSLPFISCFVTSSALANSFYSS